MYNLGLNNNDLLKSPANTYEQKYWVYFFFPVLVGRVVGKIQEYKDETSNYLNGNTDYDVEVLRVLRQDVSFRLFTRLNPSAHL